MSRKIIKIDGLKKALHTKYNLRSSDEFFDALETELKVLIGKAIKRCKANNRTTLKTRDVGY